MPDDDDDASQWMAEVGRQIAASFETPQPYYNMGLTASLDGEYTDSVSIIDPVALPPTAPIIIPKPDPDMAWRPAACLLVLLHQVDAKWPGRDKSSDGMIGDERHQAGTSDHNPDSENIVRAIDISNDPAHGLVSRKLAEALIASRDPRIRYVISNAQICFGPEAAESNNAKAWVWKAYGGENPHTAHMHLSCSRNDALADDQRAWAIDGTTPVTDGQPTLGEGSSGAPVTLAQQRLIAHGFDVGPDGADGEFGPNTTAATEAFQKAKGLPQTGVVDDATWKALRADPEPSGGQGNAAPWQSGKGSWYSWHTGKYVWEDKGDARNSNKLGVPDNAQGISFYDDSTLGDWFEVEYPNGYISIEQQTEKGPAPWTGRLIDVSAVAAERAGYSPEAAKQPNVFPTDAIIRWRRIPVPKEVAGLTPQQQAVKYRDLRKTIADKPPITSDDFATQLKAIRDEITNDFALINASVANVRREAQEQNAAFERRISELEKRKMPDTDQSQPPLPQVDLGALLQPIINAAVQAAIAEAKKSAPQILSGAGSILASLLLQWISGRAAAAIVQSNMPAPVPMQTQFPMGSVLTMLGGLLSTGLSIWATSKGALPPELGVPAIGASAAAAGGGAVKAGDTLINKPKT